MTRPASTREWLESDGLGGFASGTSTGIRTRRYLQPLLDHLGEAGLGHISEIADAEAPYTPRGCPWQAWSVGEALRLDRVVLAESAKPTRPAKPALKLTLDPVLATACTALNSVNQ